MVDVDIVGSVSVTLTMTFREFLMFKRLLKELNKNNNDWLESIINDMDEFPKPK